MRKIGILVVALIGAVYLAGTQGLLPAPLSHYFESEWETSQRLERERVTQQVADAKAGDAEAQFRYAVRLLQKSADADDVVQPDPDAALAMLEASAAQGHSLARQGLALIYIDGTLVEPDKQKVVDLYVALAEDGNDAAIGLVGSLYDQGWGVEQDDALAVEHYIKAARRGVDFSRHRLSQMLDENRVPASQRESVRDLATLDIVEAALIQSRFERTRLAREFDRLLESDPDHERMTRENLKASVTLWSHFGSAADAQGISIAYTAAAEAQEMNGPAAYLAWLTVLEALVPHVEKGRASRVAETMTDEDIAEAKALADQAIKDWNAER